MPETQNAEQQILTSKAQKTAFRKQHKQKIVNPKPETTKELEPQNAGCAIQAARSGPLTRQG